jgi:hypothetical protein
MIIKVLKFVAALHVCAYLAIVKYFKIQGNCATAISVSIFIMFLN